MRVLLTAPPDWRVGMTRLLEDPRVGYRVVEKSGDCSISIFASNAAYTELAGSFGDLHMHAIHCVSELVGPVLVSHSAKGGLFVRLPANADDIATEIQTGLLRAVMRVGRHGLPPLLEVKRQAQPTVAVPVLRTESRWAALWRVLTARGA